VSGIAIYITLILPFSADYSLGSNELSATRPAPMECSKDQGYRGIWYAETKNKNKSKFFSSGGMATAGASQVPMACYDAKANKTFFVYSGLPSSDKPSKTVNSMQIMISFFDHSTGMIPRPTILLNKIKTDPAYNPTLAIDGNGHLWVFIGTDNKDTPSLIFKSAQPYNINSFQLIHQAQFTQPQPWYVDKKGFVLIHTRNTDGCKQLYCTTSSPDGLQWNKPQLLAAIDKGHDAVSWCHKNKVGVAFNVHSNKGGTKTSTNIYFMITSDFAKTWRTMARKTINLPLKKIDNAALVRDYLSSKWLIHMMGLNIDQFGYPTILHMMSISSATNAQSNAHIWNTARWIGRGWEFSGQIRSDNVDDTGCLHTDKDRSWRIIGPTDPGPQPFHAGGEVVMWRTEDQGRSWYKTVLTQNSRFNHNFIRRPLNAPDDFNAFWCDGHAEKPSESRLYFCGKKGKVFMLPTKMTQNFEKPIPIK